MRDLTEQARLGMLAMDAKRAGRIVAEPGQALAYVVGRLKFDELRAKPRER